MRALRRISDPLRQSKQDMIELGGGGFVHGLSEIIGRSMVAVFQPFFMELLLSGVWFVTEAEGQSGDSLANKTVLIRADEDVAVRLWVGCTSIARAEQTARTSFPRVDSPRPKTRMDFSG